MWDQRVLIPVVSLFSEHATEPDGSATISCQLQCPSMHLWLYAVSIVRERDGHSAPTTEEAAKIRMVSSVQMNERAGNFGGTYCRLQ